MTRTENLTGGDIGIGPKCAFLAEPAAYGEDVRAVRTIETHMSWVFLADGFAYKLKKPKCVPLQDFGTAAARRANCEEELRLNRPLAPGVYLGIVALTREADGELALDGHGPAIDWLVKMRRLPEAAMLDVLIRKHAVPTESIDALVGRLVVFYREAPVAEWAPADYVRRIGRDVDADAAELADPRYGLPGGRVVAVLAAQRAFLAGAAADLGRRARERRVVEAHGDLRPEHVCLLTEPVVIDCVEFSRELRLLDAYEDLAYLALECERLGDAALGRHLLEAYAARSGDAPPAGLVSFYKSRRATVRAKTAAWHLRDAALADPAKWLARAREYLDIAARHAAELR